MHKTAESATRKLSDEELDPVAGGAWYGDGQLQSNPDPEPAGPGTEN